MPDLTLGWDDVAVAHDLITGERWNWAQHTFVGLGADTERIRVVHMSSADSPGR
jgi:starch synthase (maltosyl-transferring)